MEDFFDKLCRSLAAPMPRKRALKIIAGGFAGAIFAPFAFGQGNGNGGQANPNTPGGGGNSKKCSPTTCACGGGCCSTGQTCWGGSICCSPGTVGAQLKGNQYCVTLNASGTVPTGYKALSAGSTC
jgi:hypothetical protein